MIHLPHYYFFRTGFPYGTDRCSKNTRLWHINSLKCVICFLLIVTLLPYFSSQDKSIIIANIFDASLLNRSISRQIYLTRQCMTKQSVEHTQSIMLLVVQNR